MVKIGVVCSFAGVELTGPLQTLRSLGEAKGMSSMGGCSGVNLELLKI